MPVARSSCSVPRVAEYRVLGGMLTSYEAVTNEYFERRIQKLERDNRIMRMFGSISIFIIVFIVCIGAAKNEVFSVLKTKALYITDDNGNNVAGLYNRDDGYPIFFLKDNFGKTRVAIGFNNNKEPAINVLDGNEKVKLYLMVDAKEDSRAYFADNNYNSIELGALDKSKINDPFILGDKQIGLALINRKNERLSDFSLSYPSGNIDYANLIGIHYYNGKKGNKMDLNYELGAEGPYLTFLGDPNYVHSSTLNAYGYQIFGGLKFGGKEKSGSPMLVKLGIGGFNNDEVNLTIGGPEGQPQAVVGNSTIYYADKSSKMFPRSTVTLFNEDKTIKWQSKN